MKKKVFVVAAMVVCIAILAAGTLAFFTDEVVAHNVITSNEIDISIVENVADGSKPLPDGSGFEIPGAMPKTSVKKEVKVKNEAGESAWVCVRLSCSIEDKAGRKMPDKIGDVPLTEYIFPDDFSENWTKQGDLYYYNTPLSGGASTALLIKEVSFAPEMNNPYQECTVKVYVEAYAVQAKNNMPESGSVLDVKGWPDMT